MSHTWGLSTPHEETASAPSLPLCRWFLAAVARTGRGCFEAVLGAALLQLCSCPVDVSLRASASSVTRGGCRLVGRCADQGSEHGPLEQWPLCDGCPGLLAASPSSDEPCYPHRRRGESRGQPRRPCAGRGQQPAPQPGSCATAGRRDPRRRPWEPRRGSPTAGLSGTPVLGHCRLQALHLGPLCLVSSSESRGLRRPPTSPSQSSWPRAAAAPPAAGVEASVGLWSGPRSCRLGPHGFTLPAVSSWFLPLPLAQLRRSSEVMESWGYVPSQGLGRMAAKT